MTKPSRPRVTVAIPLHRSAPFVDVVSANIDRIAGDDVEILVSDRTLCDDALEVLRDRHGHDPRISFLCGTDDPGWVNHYNALLRRAHGGYFMWMPHDDDFPADYVSRLGATLDAHADALLAFGGLRVIDVDGNPVEVSYLPELPIALGRMSRADEAIALLHRWNLGIAFRGLCRRDELLRRRLTIRHTRGDVDADAYWVLAVVCAGPVVFDPECSVNKRLVPGSGSADWPQQRKSALGQFQLIPLIARYLAAARVPLRRSTRILCFVTPWAVQRALVRTPIARRGLIPARARRSVGWLLDRGLFGGPQPSAPNPGPGHSTKIRARRRPTSATPNLAPGVPYCRMSSVRDRRSTALQGWGSRRSLAGSEHPMVGSARRVTVGILSEPLRAIEGAEVPDALAPWEPGRGTVGVDEHSADGVEYL